MYKKAWCTRKVVVLLIKPIAFLTFSLPSASLDLKAPDITSFVPCSCTVAYQELHQRAFQSGVLREQTSLPLQYRDD